MIVYVWRFRADPERRAAFEAAYRTDGDWARLFAKAEGYLGTRLLRDADGAYLTLDQWRGPDDFAAFKARWGADYADLDQRCEDLTTEESFVGAFEDVNQGEEGK